MPPRVFGLLVTQNEGDILATHIRHHLAQGLERLIVVDNGSTDDTPDILAAFPGQVQWTREPGEYWQADVLNRQVAQAREQGAEWVVPLDTDEFWVGVGASLVEVLADAWWESQVVEFLHFVQRRDSDNLRTMTRRCVQCGLPPAHAVVEMPMPPKLIAPAADATPHRVGGHGPPRVNTSRIVCLHAFIRSHAALVRKARWGARRSWTPYYGRRWHALLAEGRIDDEWALNSYDEAGLLGNGHQTVEDLRLAGALPC